MKKEKINRSYNRDNLQHSSIFHHNRKRASPMRVVGISRQQLDMTDFKLPEINNPSAEKQNGPTTKYPTAEHS